VGITHYLVTSFYVKNQMNDALPSEEWLKERIILFENYCLPSVVGQTCQSFVWSIFCDYGSPDWLLRYLEDLLVPQIKVVLVKGRINGDVVRNSLENETRTSRTLTTRLDNDDAIASNFVERLQGSVIGESTVAVNFTHGLQITPMGLLWTRNLGSAFISVLDKSVNGPRTVFDFDHQLVGDSINVKQIGGSPGWMQVIHGGNVLNRAHGIPASRRRHRLLFPAVKHAPFFDFRGYLKEVRPFRLLKNSLFRRFK